MFFRKVVCVLNIRFKKPLILKLEMLERLKRCVNLNVLMFCVKCLSNPLFLFNFARVPHLFKDGGLTLLVYHHSKIFQEHFCICKHLSLKFFFSSLLKAIAIFIYSLILTLLYILSLPYLRLFNLKAPHLATFL